MSWLADLTNVSFAQPGALWLLLLLPAMALVGTRLGVRRGRIRRSVLILRLATVLLAVLTVAQPLLARAGNGTNTIFVVDLSQSTLAQRDAVNTWLQSALEGAGTEDQASIVGFGAGPSLGAPPDAAGDIDPNWRASVPDEEIDPRYSNIESALALGRALPVGGSRRIVLVSDGAENIGSSANQVAQAGADGTPIDVLPVPGIGQDDLRIDSLTAPTSIWQGDTPSVVVTVASGASGPATLELLADGQVVGTQALTVQPGIGTYSFALPLLGAGFHALAVRVAGDGSIDKITENNLAPSALVVRSAPAVLVVYQAGSDPGRLTSALQREGATVTTTTPDRVPSRLSELGAYDAVVLNNVPAGALSVDQVAGLQEASRSLGKGLIVVGGTNSYGPGQYANTELEEALPVTVKVTDGKERQKIALLLIMDRSGSMSYNPLGGPSKIEMAKEAVRAAAGSLAEGDMVGILGFSDSQQWFVQLTVIENQGTRDSVDAAIDTITATGGTEIYPALQLGFDAIRVVDADVRHVILLSDGKSQSGTREAYDQLIAQTVADRTTFSTIAIGDDADVDLLQAMAAQGGGRYHFTDKPEDIPRVTLAEAQSAGAQSVIRGAFQPIQTLPSPILTGFAPETLPALEGYNFSEAKPSAQVVLTSARNDPVLAKWQYGLGRVVAWTSDDGVDLAAGWSGWTGYDDFWSSMLRWSLPDPDNRPISVDVARDGPEALVSVTSNTVTGDYVDLASATATITAPDGTVTEGIPLYQSGPGSYQIRVAAPVSGAYAITVAPGDGSAAEQAAFTMPMSPELLPSSDGMALLEAMAAQTGGRVLSLDDPSTVFDAPSSGGAPLRNYTPVWPFPLAAALLLFVAELALRFRFVERLMAWRNSPAAA